MTAVSPDARICGSCQRSYYTWKKTNSRLERMLAGIEMDENSITDSESEVISSNFANESTMQ